MSVRRRRWFIAAVLPILLALSAFTPAALAPPPPPPPSPDAPAAASTTRPGGELDRLPRAARNELSVMSYNLRFASNTPPNSWPQRRPAVQRLLATERPDIIGTQEGLYQQLRDIEADQRGRYDMITLGRDGGSRGEAMAVLYDPRRVDPLEYDHFWLSETPDVIGSQTWAGCCPRMVTWVRFLDRRTDRQFLFVNSHYEAFDAGTRRLSAELTLEFLRGELDPAAPTDLPVVFTADFNEPLNPGGAVHDVLLGGEQPPLVDTWTSAERRGVPWGTFPNYQPPVAGERRIDAILTTPNVRTRATVINTFSLRGQFPSDHLPVQALVTVP